MFNNSKKIKMEQSCQENHQWKLKTGWKFEAEDDIYIISTYLPAIIYYKGKISLLYEGHEGKNKKSDRKMDKGHVKMVHKR